MLWLGVSAALLFTIVFTGCSGDIVSDSPGDSSSDSDIECQIHVQSCTGESVRYFYDDFENSVDSEANWGTTNYSFDTGYLGGQAIRIDVTDPETTRIITFNLPVEDLRGTKVTVTAKVKAENISDKPKDWNGIKFMLRVVGPAGTTYPSAKMDTGTFDWQYQGLLSQIPEDAETVTLYLGLEQVTGSAWFDEIELRVDSCEPIISFNSACPIYTGHEVPILRGAMVSPKTVTSDDIRVLGQEWNANVLRWPLFGTTETDLGASDFDDLLLAQTDLLDAVLPACQEYGVLVVLDLHSNSMGMFDSVANQDKFVEVWRDLAEKYMDNETIWAYDLKNEPSDIFPRPGGVLDWRELAEKAAKAIRSIDPETTIIVEPPHTGGPFGYVGFFPIDVPNVVYSVHMYEPTTFTHQTISDDTLYVYPGEIDGEYWDKDRLELSLKPVIDFAQAYHVQIFVGEFSAIRWAPDNSAYRYLEDAIEIFEEYQWDWTYHAFREWDGWSVEHSEDRDDHNPTATPNDRQNLLRWWLSENVTPL